MLLCQDESGLIVAGFSTKLRFERLWPYLLSMSADDICTYLWMILCVLRTKLITLACKWFVCECICISISRTLICLIPWGICRILLCFFLFSMQNRGTPALKKRTLDTQNFFIY